MSKADQPDRLMIDATHRKAYRTTASLLKSSSSSVYQANEGCLTSKLHAVTNGLGRPLLFFLTLGQASDYYGARRLLDCVSKAKGLLTDRDYDADWFRNCLKDKGICPCTPPRTKRHNPTRCPTGR
ncbi:transposase [Agrobacterium larrymoorei]|uniref:Transposase n=1 Tax=Agrobacterium larrymoorei TaxID=160699 RepID=A0AAF0HBH3_9HYPH|nr:transposase [Agrobacterium larrymoorei]WHA42622.1 transposase [Agrobacterium larrymoorei]